MLLADGLDQIVEAYRSVHPAGWAAVALGIAGTAMAGLEEHATP